MSTIGSSNDSSANAAAALVFPEGVLFSEPLALATAPAFGSSALAPLRALLKVTEAEAGSDTTGSGGDGDFESESAARVVMSLALLTATATQSQSRSQSRSGSGSGSGSGSKSVLTGAAVEAALCNAVAVGLLPNGFTASTRFANSLWFILSNAQSQSSTGPNYLDHLLRSLDLPVVDPSAPVLSVSWLSALTYSPDNSVAAAAVALASAIAPLPLPHSQDALNLSQRLPRQHSPRHLQAHLARFLLSPAPAVSLAAATALLHYRTRCYNAYNNPRASVRCPLFRLSPSLLPAARALLWAHHDGAPHLHRAGIALCAALARDNAAAVVSLPRARIEALALSMDVTATATGAEHNAPLDGVSSRHSDAASALVPLSEVVFLLLSTRAGDRDPLTRAAAVRAVAGLPTVTAAALAGALVKRPLTEAWTDAAAGNVTVGTAMAAARALAESATVVMDSNNSNTTATMSEAQAEAEEEDGYEAALSSNGKALVESLAVLVFGDSDESVARQNRAGYRRDTGLLAPPVASAASASASASAGASGQKKKTVAGGGLEAEADDMASSRLTSVINTSSSSSNSAGSFGLTTGNSKSASVADIMNNRSGQGRKHDLITDTAPRGAAYRKRLDAAAAAEAEAAAAAGGARAAIADGGLSFGTVSANKEQGGLSLSSSAVNSTKARVVEWPVTPLFASTSNVSHAANNDNDDDDNENTPASSSAANPATFAAVSRLHPAHATVPVLHPVAPNTNFIKTSSASVNNTRLGFPLAPSAAYPAGAALAAPAPYDGAGGADLPLAALRDASVATSGALVTAGEDEAAAVRAAGVRVKGRVLRSMLQFSQQQEMLKLKQQSQSQSQSQSQQSSDTLRVRAFVTVATQLLLRDLCDALTDDSPAIARSAARALCAAAPRAMSAVSHSNIGSNDSNGDNASIPLRIGGGLPLGLAHTRVVAAGLEAASAAARAHAFAVLAHSRFLSARAFLAAHSAVVRALCRACYAPPQGALAGVWALSPERLALTHPQQHWHLPSQPNTTLAQQHHQQQQQQHSVSEELSLASATFAATYSRSQPRPSLHSALSSSQSPAAPAVSLPYCPADRRFSRALSDRPGDAPLARACLSALGARNPHWVAALGAEYFFGTTRARAESEARTNVAALFALATRVNAVRAKAAAAAGGHGACVFDHIKLGLVSLSNTNDISINASAVSTITSAGGANAGSSSRGIRGGSASASASGTAVMNIMNMNANAGASMSGPPTAANAGTSINANTGSIGATAAAHGSTAAELAAAAGVVLRSRHHGALVELVVPARAHGRNPVYLASLLTVAGAVAAAEAAGVLPRGASRQVAGRADAALWGPFPHSNSEARAETDTYSSSQRGVSVDVRADAVAPWLGPQQPFCQSGLFRISANINTNMSSSGNVNNPFGVATTAQVRK